MCHSLSSRCASCKESFTSYSQHLPITVLPQGRPLQTLNALLAQGQIPTSFAFDDTGSVWQPIPSLDEEPSVILSCRPYEFSPPIVIPSASVCYSTPDLPTEVWIKIFAEACTDLHRWLTVLRISLVCHHWRDIAHSLPLLWTSICVDVLHVKQSEMWTPWRSFETVWWFLHLSKHEPLDVKVDLLGCDGDLEFECTVEMLAEHSRR
ncbi:uncharacterized protein BT62DRAFT_793084 [Guyanagaster necrorhizus]|uniref:F-box domain-containing protein n=1 Tax=Guyanagaster necrorhizus TaxID=856835 RepID=A0A9P7VXT6_9AGAR|nr:uncharacterized protein BT62DRAFT_793084 [Guyanagaster necrorhizus MCA 3950]KAG7447791.1 hypothetical protein BT62DRAFT_793084 [Guyanagaster necrorhizus MCA 3950]